METHLTLEVPDFVTLADGTVARVKAVAANIVDGGLCEIVYTIEKETGAWTEVGSEEVQPKRSGSDGSV